MFRQSFQHTHCIERRRISMPPFWSMRLNRGEVPIPLPPDLVEAIDEALSFRTLNYYPSYDRFYLHLAEFVDFPVKQIVAGAGIEEFIRTLTFMCCEPPHDEVAVLWPSCAMYDLYADVFGVRQIRIPSVQTQGWNVEKLIRWLECYRNLRLLFVPNPGQPVQTYYAPNELRELAHWCSHRDILLAIDEAHFGFGAETAFPLVNDFENVLVLRTFSKLMSAASIRVGFAVGPERLIRALHAVRPSGELSSLSMAVATVLMQNIHVLEQRACSVVEGRNYLRQMLRGELVRSYGDRGLSVLIRLDSAHAASAVGCALAKVHGILVKYDLPELVNNCLLLSCGDRKMMQKFFAAFMEEYRNL